MAFAGCHLIKFKLMSQYAKALICFLVAKAANDLSHKCTWCHFSDMMSYFFLLRHSRKLEDTKKGINVSRSQC